MKGNRSMQAMTEGRPISLILKFFFPLLFGMLFQQFYNLVDTAIVGKFLGPDDLAAVGATGSVNFLILGFCMGVCNGFSIPVAQKFGAKDESGLRRFVANSVWLPLRRVTRSSCLSWSTSRSTLPRRCWSTGTSWSLIIEYTDLIVCLVGGNRLFGPDITLHRMMAVHVYSASRRRSPVSASCAFWIFSCSVLSRSTDSCIS